MHDPTGGEHTPEFYDASSEMLERRQQERRQQERRQQERSPDFDCHDSPCVDLIVTENRLTQLANEFYSYKTACNREIKKLTVERRDILDKLDKIEGHLDKQKGFFAGVVWVVGAAAGVIGLAVSYFKS